jgi:ankyrin repeat protein
MLDFEEIASLIRNNKIDILAAHFEDRVVGVDVRDPVNGNTLLHVACQNGSKRAVKCILRQGNNMNAQNNHGNTPLHFLEMYGFRDLSAYIKSKGADDSLINKDGLTCYELNPSFCD